MTEPFEPTDVPRLLAALRTDGWRELRHAIPNAPLCAIDPEHRVRAEVHEPHLYPYTLLRNVECGTVLAEFGPPTPHPVIAAAARASCSPQSGGIDTARAITELGFTPAPSPAQLKLPALAYTHPGYAATAYLYPQEEPGQGESWSVYGPDDDWVAALEPGVSGALLAAILTATRHARPGVTGAEGGCGR